MNWYEFTIRENGQLSYAQGNGEDAADAWARLVELNAIDCDDCVIRVRFLAYVK